MNTIKTVGLVAVLAAGMGATDATADHRDRGHHRPRINIILGGPDGLCINPYAPYYIQDPYAPYGGYPGYGYPPYGPYGQYGVEIPLGRDMRIHINDGRHHNPPYYGPYYPYGNPYCY